ncbi:hypothetical protein MAFF241647_14800 [Ralstonia solanacearum]|uniref:hypothetical protein n=1 Tax=Ralstonia pseudosolanacearum TaxID=1310165 RepID=UPI0018A5004D|nr:hypothetical protein [Ralstonia pseudosolanacearum]MDO3517724.1 hypothetical protein [Ralstonia pseudosolanacearum]MDO3541009.1 hypothetical protein [Ralstonia pseudosolanacearum]BCM07123.1 hypothetical protein MAFF241647_14800 [Ralstonia solanacearum]
MLDRFDAGSGGKSHIQMEYAYTYTGNYRRNRDAMQGWTKWVNAQPVQNGWRLVTLEYPRWKKIGLWSEAVKHTMRELSQTFLKGALATQNKATGANSLRRVVALGGDRANGVALHAHCLVDGMGDDEKFDEKLDRSWVNNVGRIVRRDGLPFREGEAKVFSRRIDGTPTDYIHYIVRYEGSDLNFGANKIDVSNTYLT